MKRATDFPAAVAAMMLWLLPAVGLTAGAQAAGAQTSTSAPPVSSDTIRETEKNQAKKGKVILQRSVDERGEATDAVQVQAPDPPVPVVVNADPVTGKAPVGQTGVGNGPAVSDTDRAAVTFTDFDLDVRLRPAEGFLAARALVSVRNDGKVALARLPLQLSSTLNWEQIRIKGQSAPFTVGLLNSDADHTGQLREATVVLPAPLAAGASLQLDVTYSGTVAKSAKRLLAIGTPEDVAEHSDWDRVSSGFTGLRGFGNVVWYPVSSVPVILGDGARLFDEIGTHKLKLAGARFRMSLTVESAAGQAPGGSVPSIALINGYSAPLAAVAGTDATVATISTARVDGSTLRFEAPSLFLANRTSHAITNATVWTRPDSEKNVAAWGIASADVTPFLQGWLGRSPRSQLTILDLPEEGDIPFETAAMLATPVRAAAPDVLEGVLAHALTHAWVMSKRAWLSEGVAHFMGTLWIEKQQGRDRALATLDNGRAALTLVEPESPGAGDGQPLVACISPVYYRTKAAYVFWMLRDMVGDATLSASLRAYDPARDEAADSFERLVEQAGQRHDLRWFFADWVYADKGLPDLSVESVFPSAASVPGSYLVAVNMANNGYATVEAPVQVISETASITQRVLLTARSKSVQRILIQGTPVEVRLNDGTVPETQATVHVKTLEPAKPKP